MKQLTPFQEALLEANTQVFSDIPAEDRIDLIPSQNFDQHVEKIAHRPKTVSRPLRRCLIAAAVILLLVGSAFAGIHFSVGDVEVKEDIYHFPEFGTANSSYQIVFHENIAAENAPNHIETYYLPTALVNDSNMDKYDCYMEDTDSAYYLYRDQSEENQPLKGEATTIHHEWLLDAKQDEWGMYGTKRVWLTQRTAKHVKPGVPVMDYQMDAENPYNVSEKNFVQGDYEIFCFMVDFSPLAFTEEEKEQPIARFWYWTDGNYLYELFCGTGISDAEMLEIFESITPVY